MGYFHEDANSGASANYQQMLCSSLQENGLVMLKARPCMTQEMSIIKKGEHEPTEVNLKGIDIFTLKEIEASYVSTDIVDVPVVYVQYFQLIDVRDDGFATLKNDKGETRDDLRFRKKDLIPIVKDGLNKEGIIVRVAVAAFAGKETIIGYKLKRIPRLKQNVTCCIVS